ncbi:MAG: hypothetical protein ABI321_06465 [Polyangia bacterium]
MGLVSAAALLSTATVGENVARAAPRARASVKTPELRHERFFVVIEGVEEADGVKSGLVPELKRLFAEEIARHPELVLGLPDVTADPATEPQAFKDSLHKNGINRALDMSLRVLEVTSGLEPPPAGKPFRVVKRGIHLAVFGTTLPEKIMAIGGDGDANVAAEIRKTEDDAVEGKKLMMEAATSAIKQAVDMTVTKLELPAPKDPKAKKKKKQ